jgi:hypothetical protein
VRTDGSLRRGHSGGANVALTVLAIVLVIFAWVFVTAWYLVWVLWLIPYRLLRRGARKRKAEALRHRELLGTIQGSAAASAATIVTVTATETVRANLQSPDQSHLRVDADERQRAADDLNAHYVAGRLTHEELDERLTQAYASRTRGDLANLVGDLPPLFPGQPGQRTLPA